MSTQTAVTMQASVLVVDDEARQLAALCDTLEDAGYKATGFTSAREALAALRETEFDLLLTDLMMPEMDGVALLRAAQAIDSHLVGVVATAHGTIDTAVRAMQAGALDYILKPFKLSTALPVIERAITVKRLRSENIQLREALALSEVSTTVASVLDPPVVLNKVADAVFNSLGANGTALFTANHDRQTLEATVVRGEAWSRLRDVAYPIDQSVSRGALGCRICSVNRLQLKLFRSTHGRNWVRLSLYPCSRAVDSTALSLSSPLAPTGE